MTNRILIIDDDLITLELIQKALSKQNYEVIATDNPKEALKLFLENPALVVLSDLNMPEMNGDELMSRIFQSGHKPIFLMLTGETDVNKAVELFKQGIHDYIIKPFNPMELLNRINKAFEFAELRLINQNIQKEREIRIEHQLNWNLYKENLIKKESDKTEGNLMTSINNSLIQGAGIGTLNFLIEMIEEGAALEDNRYSVDKELLETLFESARFSKKLINIIGDIDYVINTDLPKTMISITEFHTMVSEVVQDISEYQKVRGNTIIVANDSYFSNKKSLNINTVYFKKAIQELLFNALKFSEEGSKIYIIFEVGKNGFIISFLNSPQQETKEQNGIPSEYERIIFEPFFRISKFAYEKYPTLDFGLGLCYVEKIIRNHKGSIRVLNLKNYLEQTNQILIDFSMEIPYASQEIH